MNPLNDSDVRIPRGALGEVARGKRVRIERRGGEAVYLISEQDLRLLEALEDRLDAAEAREALERHKASGGLTIPLEEVEARLGL